VKRLDLRLAIPVAVAWAAVAVLVGFPAALPWAAGVLWATATLCFVGARVTQRGALSGLAFTLGVGALLVTVAALHAPARQPQELLADAAAGRQVTVTVTAQATVRSGASFDGTATAFTSGLSSLTGSAPVTVFPQQGDTFNAAIGSTLRVRGTLVATDPGDQVAFRVFGSDGARRVAASPWYLSWADGLRADFGRATASLPGDGGALLPGLAIGDTLRVGDSLDSAMKATSLSHLTAVSGANCAVVIALIMLAGARAGLPRGWRIGASVVLLIAFVVLVTPQPSVLRAAVMSGIVLGTLALGRPVSGLPVLSLATLVLLLSDPWLSRSYGFVLSVLATAGLVVLARPLGVRLSRWMPRWLALTLAIPLSAQLACQPVLLLLNPTIPTYGVFANLLAEPAAPIATVLGLVACLLLPIAPALGAAVAAVAWVPSAWIAGVAEFFTALPLSALPWPGGAVGVALCALMILLALAIVLGGRRVRIAAASALALLIVVTVGVTASSSIHDPLVRPTNWQIAACDIGQGDSVLVRSLGKVALVDTGPDPALLTRCLQELGITHIDLLVLTHYDLDHVGGTSAVFGMVTRAMIGPTADSHDEALAESVAAHGAEVQHVSQGLTGILGELRWDVLWPPSPLGNVQPGNDASVTVRFSGAGACAAGCLTSIFLGDLGDQPQSRVLGANPTLGKVDVVKVAHHGSADQDEQMYQTIKATVGLISVGLGNTYGHPTDRLLGILNRAGTLAFRTDYEGMILVSPLPGGGETVWTERSMPAAKLTQH
jgi:competence protein ComEC